MYLAYYDCVQRLFDHCDGRCVADLLRRTDSELSARRIVYLHTAHSLVTAR